MGTNLPAFLPWLLFVWMGIETAWDLHSHDIPLWFSLVMLAPGIILLAIAAPLVAFLALSLIHI